MEYEHPLSFPFLLKTLLPRDTMLAGYMLLSCVRPSITSWHCTKAVKHRIMQTMLYDSPGTIFLTPKISAKF